MLISNMHITLKTLPSSPKRYKGHKAGIKNISSNNQYERGTGRVPGENRRRKVSSYFQEITPFDQTLDTQDLGKNCPEEEGGTYFQESSPYESSSFIRHFSIKRYFIWQNFHIRSRKKLPWSRVHSPDRNKRQSPLSGDCCVLSCST